MGRVVPFGFRQDVEDPRPELEDEGQRKEVNNTSVHTERAWTRVILAPASSRLTTCNEEE